MDKANRVDLTQASVDLLRELVIENGPLMFHQSGGCCDGSAPMCYPKGEFMLGGADVYLGDLDISKAGETPDEEKDVVQVWMSKAQFEYWQHTHLTIDVVKGRGAGFSVEAPRGVRFLIRSRLLTDEEFELLEDVTTG